MKKLLLISAFVLIGCSPVEEDTRLICDCSDTSYEFKYTPSDEERVSFLKSFIENERFMGKMSLASIARAELQTKKKYAFNRPQGVPSKNACGQAPASDNNVLVFNRSKNKFIWNGIDTGSKELDGSISWTEDDIASSYTINDDQFFLSNDRYWKEGSTTSNRLKFNRVNLKVSFTKMSAFTHLEMFGGGKLVTNDEGETKIAANYTKEILDKTMQITYQCRVVQGI